MVETVDDLDDFRRWLAQPRPVLGLDTETEGLDWWRQRLRLVQVGDAMTGWAFRSPQWDGPLLGDLLPRYTGPVALHNAKFDAHFLRHWGGYRMPWERTHDTKVMAHLAAPLGPMGLKELGDQVVDPRISYLESKLHDGMLKNRWGWDTVPYDFGPYWQYGALDPVITARVAEHLWPLVQPYRRLYEVEIALEALLERMETRGVRVDVDYCREAAARHRRDAEVVRQRIRDGWGLTDPGSTQAVAYSLQQHGATLTALTSKGKWQMDEAALVALEHPLADTVLEMRALEKVASTYLEPFVRFQDNGRIHAGVNATAARTGRMSISRPSLQNLPRTKIAREAFIPAEGNVLMLADFQQIEMRVLAHYAQENRMIDAIKAGVDLHTFTAQRAYGVEAPSKKQRQVAKSSNFAILYGAGTAKFAETAGIGVPEAADFLERYNVAFPRVRPFIDRCATIGRQRMLDEGEGYITTWGGRRLPADPDRLYTLVNYLIQGSARDVFGQKMLEMDAAGLGDFMILPIHDEVVLDVPAGDAADAQDIIEQSMPLRGEMAVDLEIDVNVVNRWGDRYE